MAIYDRREHKIVVRVVYDGAARSGKTTNVQRICSSFTTLRRGEMFVPEVSGGRTQYFDWLQLDSGLVGGIPLRCQLVTVPGQESLRHRREHLLRSADVVVFVADSTPDGLVDAMRAYAELRALVTSLELTPPVIVQANKQDLADAVGLVGVQVTLGLDNSTTVAVASAERDAGVRETLVLAIRAAANDVQRRLLEDGVDALEGVSDSPEALYDAMRAARAVMGLRIKQTATTAGIATPAENEPDLDAILEIEEVAADADDHAGAVAEAEASEVADVDADVAEHAELEASAEAGVDAETNAHEGVVAEGEAKAEADLDASAAVESGATALEPASSNGTGSGNGVAYHPGRAEAAVEHVDEPVAQAVEPGRSDRAKVPALPDPMVPSGFIWPGSTGRQRLRDLLECELVHRDDLVGRHGAVDGSGTSDLVLLEAGTWFLKTSVRRRYDDVDTARDALLRLARKKVALGELLLEDTVLSLRPDDDGALWLWTVAPSVVTLRARMVAADHGADDASLGDALVEFARAAIESLILAATRGLVLDVHPGNFASVEADGLVYIDDDIENGSLIPLIGHMLMGRIHEYEHRPEPVKRYAEALSSGFRERLSGPQIQMLDLPDALAASPARSSFAREMRSVLVDSVLGAQPSI